MSEAVSAGVEIQGSVLRYAEVEYGDNRHRLLRIGQHAFGFDAAAQLLRADSPRRLGEVVTALQNAFDGTDAEELALAVHPADAYSFFTPIEADLPVRERKLNLLQHAAIVTGARSAKDYHLATQTVRTAQDSEGEPVMWVHVLAVPEDIHERVGQIVDGLPFDRFSWMMSTEAASHVTSRIELTGVTQEQALRPYTLAIGQYAGVTEFTLSRDRQWFHSHFAERADTPSDRVYYAVGLLNRLDVPLNGIGRLFIYGRDVDAEVYQPFRPVFGVHPEPLDPFRAANPAGTSLNGIEPTTYVPCIGASM